MIVSGKDEDNSDDDNKSLEHAISNRETNRDNNNISVPVYTYLIRVGNIEANWMPFCAN